MRFRLSSYFFLALFIAITPRAFAEPAKPNFSELESLVQDGLKRNNIPGCAVAIVLGDEIVFAKGFGIVNVDAPAPVTADTLFRLGSTTKMFTAATLVSLAEAGKVKLDAPLGNLAKGLPPKIARLTPHELLSHTAGLADETKMEGSHDESSLKKELLARGDDLCFTEPEKIWSYSNPGYWYAGLAIEEASGKNYGDAVREQILAPLGMKRSTFRPVEAMTWPVAIGHGPEGRGEASVIRPLADNAAGAPAGQLFTTANEYARFCIAFVNGGKLDGKQALSNFVIEKLSTLHVALPDGKRHYGYGLSVEDEDGLRWVSHGGSRTGYGSIVRMCPAKKFAVIILCNKTGQSLPKVAEKAAELALNISPPKREPPGKPQPITADDLRRNAGIYSNGKTSIRVVARDGKLITAGGELTKVGENRFTRGGDAAGAESELLFVPANDGRIEYLMRGGRALKKN